MNLILLVFTLFCSSSLLADKISTLTVTEQAWLSEHKDDAVLQSILNKNLVNDKVNRLNLTSDEKLWVDKKIPIRYVYNPDWAPFEWTNDVGKHEGFISDILRRIKEISRLNFQHISTDSWADATKKVIERQADMYSAVGMTEERQQYMQYTEKTLFSTPYVLVMRKTDKAITDLNRFIQQDEIVRPPILALVEHYTIHGLMKKNKPTIPLFFLKGTASGFDQLLSNTIDGFLVNKVTAKYFINKTKYQSLKIVHQIDEQLNLHIAIRNDWSNEAVSIINKSLELISDKELIDIYEKWIEKDNDIHAIEILLGERSDALGEITKISFLELINIEEIIFIAIIFFLAVCILYKNYIKYSVLNTTLRQFIVVIISFEMGMIIFIIYQLFDFNRIEMALTKIYVDKFELIKTADKLRQSSDDLTHYARTYVVTNNVKYKQNYIDILAIRNGEKPRPFLYEAIYWDLPERERQLLHPDVKKMALKELIAALPYSEKNLQWLIEAEKNSNDLVNLEVRAFKAMEDHNQALAIELLHSNAYYDAKSSIMLPIDKMITNLYMENEYKIVQLEGEIRFSFRYLIVASFLFALGNIIIYLMLVKKLNEPIEYLTKTIRQFRKGEKGIREKVFYQDEIGEMNKQFFVMQKTIEKQRKSVAENQQAVIEAEQQTRLLLTSVGEGIFGVGKDGLVNFINPAALDMLQYTENEILGQQVHAIIHHSHSDGSEYPVEECPMYHAFSEGKISKIEDEVLWRKDGSYFPVEYKARPVMHNNELAGSVIAFSDISERLKAHTALVEQQQEIKKIHQHTRDSIEYSALIQGAVLPEHQLFRKYFKDYFIVWQPKDTVGGDIYLFDELRAENECLFMFIDCTGHGVPGAFVTMLVKAIERQVVAEIKGAPDMVVSPAWVLAYFNQKLKVLLKQENKDSISNAGWDGGVIYYNREQQVLKFSGAETSLFYIDLDGSFHTIKGNRYSVGYKKCAMDYEYKETIIDVRPGMKFYCTTDGYLDQNGGEKDFPFSKKRFGNIIKENHTETMADQQEIFLYKMSEYESMIENNERNDDITLIAFEIDDYIVENKINNILKYNGALTQNLIAHNLDILDYSVGNESMKGRLSTILIEMMQNMINYSKSQDLNCKVIHPAGLIAVNKDENEDYWVESSNIVSVEDKAKIEQKLLEIQALDMAGIKKRYRELRRSGENSHSVGGGIGFYEIAKLVQLFDFKFTAINQEKFSFDFKVLATKSKKQRLNS